MSFTLRGRLETRLVAFVAPFVAACALALAVDAWWPVELAVAMLTIGLFLDATIYHRAFPYQPGWLALPLGLLELGLVMAVVYGLRIDAPLAAALGFFAAAWLIAQLVAHAGLPLARLSYADDGGELGRAGVLVAVVASAGLASVGGAAWASMPPTVHLAAGVHQGPLLIDSEEHLVGEPGAIVRGGIEITADGVTVRDVTVLGGEHGIHVDGAERVVLERVRISGASLDGINARRSQVTVRDCIIQNSGGGEYVQGIDISFSFDLRPSVVEDCLIHGGREGIVTHFANVHVEDNRVSGTSLRGITLTEMSMGAVEDNEVTDGLGVGIYCGDFSECEIEDNVVQGTRIDEPSGSRTRRGYAVVVHSGATATLVDNELGANPNPVGTFLDAEIERE